MIDPSRQRLQQRLIGALAASALLHLWLAHMATEHSAARVRVAGAAPLRATLSAAPTDVTAAPRETPPPASKSGHTASTVRGASTVPVPSFAGAANEPTTVPHDGSAAFTQPADPTYYSARSLDVFPKAITTLALNAQPGAATVRAMVFIDESGTVTDVRIVESGSADRQAAAREVLLSTRFTPAGKDGRIVKAQVLVSLD